MSTFYGLPHSPLASDASLLPYVDSEGNLSVFVDLWSRSIKLTFVSAWERDGSEDGYLHCNNLATLKSTANISVLQYPWLSALRLFWGTSLIVWHPSSPLTLDRYPGSDFFFLCLYRARQRVVEKDSQGTHGLSTSTRNSAGLLPLLSEHSSENCRANPLCAPLG